MTNVNWVEIAVRIIDYCQTRDAFLRAQDATPEMVQMWAEEFARSGQSEEELRDAAAGAYRKAGGKPPADPLGAIVAEARSQAASRRTLTPFQALPAPRRGTGPIDAAYAVYDAIGTQCLPQPKSNGAGVHHGCGAQPGDYCRSDTGIRQRPHWARLLRAQTIYEQDTP